MLLKKGCSMQQGLSFSAKYASNPAGRERRPNQSWTYIICSGLNQCWMNAEWILSQLSVQGRTNPERIMNHDRTVVEPILLIRSATVRVWFLLIRSATVRLWFTYVSTPFTFWFSRTDPESKMPAYFYVSHTLWVNHFLSNMLGSIWSNSFEQDIHISDFNWYY